MLSRYGFEFEENTKSFFGYSGINPSNSNQFVEKAPIYISNNMGLVRATASRIEIFARQLTWGSSTDYMINTAGYLESGNEVVIPTVYSDRNQGVSLRYNLLSTRENAPTTDCSQ